jgi:hypothetical protein
MQTDKKLEWCANGKPGYDIQTGKPYTPMHACTPASRTRAQDIFFVTGAAASPAVW